MKSDLLRPEKEGNYKSQLAAWAKLTLDQKVGELLGSVEGGQGLSINFNKYERERETYTFLQHNNGHIDINDVQRLLKLPDTNSALYKSTKKGLSDKGGGGKYTCANLSQPHEKFTQTDGIYDQLVNEKNILNHTFMGFKLVDDKVINFLNTNHRNDGEKEYSKDNYVLIFYLRTPGGDIKYEIHFLEDFKEYSEIFKKYKKEHCDVFWNVYRDLITDDVKKSMNTMFYKTRNIIFDDVIPLKKPDLIGPSIIAPYLKYLADIYEGPSGSKGSFVCLRFLEVAHLPPGWGGTPRDFRFKLNKDYWFHLKRFYHDCKPVSSETGAPLVEKSWHYQLIQEQLLKTPVCKPTNINKYNHMQSFEIQVQNIPVFKKELPKNERRQKDPRIDSGFYDNTFLRRPNILLERNGCIVNYSPEPWENKTLPPHLYSINQQASPIVNVYDLRGTRNLKNGKYDYLNHQNIFMIIKQNPIEGSYKSPFVLQLIKPNSGLWGCKDRELGYRIRNTAAGSKYSGELPEYSWQGEVFNFMTTEILLDNLFYKRLNKRLLKNQVEQLKQVIAENYKKKKERDQRIRSLRIWKKFSKLFFDKFTQLKNIDNETMKTEAEKLVEERNINIKKNKAVMVIQNARRWFNFRKAVKKKRNEKNINKIVAEKTKALKLQITELKNDKQTLTEERNALDAEVKEKNVKIRDLENEEPEYDDDEILFKREPTEKTKYNLWVRAFSFTDNEGNTHIPAYGKCLICQSVISVSPLFKRRRNGCLSLSGGHVIPHTPITRHNEPLHKRGFQVLNNFIPLCINCNSSMSNNDARVYMRRLIKDAESTGMPPPFDKDKVNEIYGPFWKNLHEDYKNIHHEEYYLKNHLI
jgi:5-methylcytosine-specific restriction endonuclease McrA